MAETPLLSICVPTYNRGPRVYSLVVFLLENIISKYPEKIELIVVNNCSGDDTESLIGSLTDRGVRLVNRAEHLPSAEANMFASLGFCKGRFVWFHGDDDVPVPDTIVELLDSLEKEDADLYVFNVSTIDLSGSLVSERALKMNREYLDVGADGLVSSCGFLYMLAGISNVVFRRKLAKLEYLDEISGYQEIYSHVVWFIRCFSGSRIRIKSRPIVYYRTDTPENQFRHFVGYAKRHGYSDRYIWGLGLVDMLRYLVDGQYLSADAISRIYDGRRDGTRFRFLDELVNQLYLQVRLSVESGDRRNRVSCSDFRLAKDFLYRVDLFFYERLSLLDEMLKISDKIWEYGVTRGLSKTVHELFSKFEILQSSQANEGYYRALYSGNYFGYSVYKTPVGYVALSSWAETYREDILSYIDPMEVAPHVLIATDLAVLKDRMSLECESISFGQGPTSSNLDVRSELRGDFSDHIDQLKNHVRTRVDVGSGDVSAFAWDLPFSLLHKYYWRVFRGRVVRRLSRMLAK